VPPPEVSSAQLSESMTIQSLCLASTASPSMSATFMNMSTAAGAGPANRLDASSSATSNAGRSIRTMRIGLI